MPLSEAALGAIISGAASVAGAGISAGSAALQNRRSYKWSKKFFDYQNYVNQTQYSPAQNMERYRQAGINPNLVAGSATGGTAVSGSMSTPDYQSPLGFGDQLAGAIGQAYNIYSQQRQLQNNTDLVKSQVDKNNAETNKTQYYLSNIMPQVAEYEKNRSQLPLYQIGQLKLANQKLMNEISLFSMQKQKYQLGLDLLEIEKKYADEYYNYRNQSVKADVGIKQAEKGIRSLDLKNYQTFGIRPQDPYYARIGANIADRASKSDSKFGRWLHQLIFGN